MHAKINIRLGSVLYYVAWKVGDLALYFGDNVV